MTAEELEELQDSDTWEYANERVCPAVPNLLAAVSVVFSRTEFEAVQRSAQAHGLNLDDFIRQTALERARSADASDEPASSSVRVTAT